jgi:sugar lactone lactonase YvrE
MKLLTKFAFAFAFLPVADAVASEKKEPSYPVVWTIDSELKAPESAYFDVDSGFLFLSQIGGGGGVAKDGDGWISKLTVDGAMVKNKWISGLNAPKGLRSHNGTLWVSDIDRIVGIDMARAKVTHDVMVPGAKFLNDVACGLDGSVYVSDTRASRIHRYKDGKLTVLAEGDEIEHPNGLLVDGKRLIVAGWGRGVQEDFVTKTPGRLFSIDLDSGDRAVITRRPFGNLDGLELDGKGGYVVSDWMAGKIFHVSKAGDVKLLMTLQKGSADHALLVKKGWLIVPGMLQNSLTAFDVTKAIQQ